MTIACTYSTQHLPWEDVWRPGVSGQSCDTAQRFRLLNDWQHNFPLVEEPFMALGAAVGLQAEAVVETFCHEQGQGVVSRIGPVARHHQIGSSTLVALKAPPERLLEVAARINTIAEVNHNYEREHDDFNLWFVITAADATRLQAIIAGIDRDTGCRPLQLPMEEVYHVDLGFDLRGNAGPRQSSKRGSKSEHLSPREQTSFALKGVEAELFAALQRGLPLVQRPYAAVGRRLGLSSKQVCDTLAAWLSKGVLRRFGVVLRHHELGWQANAMCVWNVADDQVALLGRRLGEESGVTLCYRRRRALPYWQYNLFCMIHGRAREEVLARRDCIAARLQLDSWPHDVLFSRRRFKQRGACYVTAAAQSIHV